MTTTYLVILLLAGGTKALIPPGEVGSECLQGTVRCLQPNSECIEGTCLCANFYRFLNGTCVTEDQSASLGKPCRGGGDCRGSGEFCSSYSVCMCLSTHVDVGSQCRPAVYPGQFGCEDSRQCNKGFPGAECDASRMCVCPHGMHAQQQTCVLSLTSSNVILSDDRFSSIRRSSSNFFSRRRYQQSSALPGGIPPDSICSVDADCSGYPLSYCDGVCRCVSGALNAGSTCISSGNALQPAGSCAAGQTYVTEAGACMTVQQPGEPCQYSQQCAASEPGAFCLRLRCECVYGMKQSGTGCTFVDNQCTKRGFIWISELGECKEVLPPGGRGCSHSLQCTQAYPEASCFLQTCTCPISFPIPIDGTCGRNCSAGETYSGVTGQCLPTVKPGNQCLYSSQCHAINPGMICDRNRCRCPSGMVFSGTKCTQQCPVGFIVNSKGVCSPGCRINQVEYEGECLDQVAPGANCMVNAQCMGGASCQSGSCLCPKGMVPRGSVCVYIESPPGGSCGDGQQCTGSSFCSNGNCTCPAGRQIVNGICMTPQTVPPNSPCNPSVTCGGGSTCLGSVCTCPTNQSPLNGQCQIPAAVPPGSPCPTGNERCLGQSSCISGVCQCPFGTYPNKNECVPIQASQAGAPCDANTRCTGLAVCVDGTCQCPAGLVASGGDCRAATQVAPGSSCALGEVCVGGSSCIANICTCPPQTKMSNGVCLPFASANPGSTCTGGEVCVGGSNCQNGVCVCPLGSVNHQGVCQSTAGSLGQCDANFNCLGGAVCDRTRNQCTCPANTVLVGSLCIAPIPSPTRFSQLPISSQLKSDLCNYDGDCDDGRVCVLNRCRCMFGDLPDGTCRNLWTRRNTISRHEIQREEEENSSNETSTQKPIVIPGGSCSENDECIGGSSCRGGICMCPVGQTIVAHVCKTIVKAMPGNTCANGEVCDGGSFCHQPTKVCRCQPGFMSVRGSCQPLSNRAVASNSSSARSCLASNQCPSGAECVGGECRCSPGLALSRFGFCMPLTYVDPGMSCKEGETCRGGSECREGICVCGEGLFVRENKCLPPVSDGQETRRRRALPGIDDSTFLKLVTQAEKLSSNGKKSLALGERCSLQSICDSGGQCLNGFCRCPDGQIQAGTSCLQRSSIGAQIVQPGQDCQSEYFCDGGASCVSFQCRCPSGSEPNSGVCTPILAKASDDCSSGQRCSAGSLCVQGKCICPKGFTNLDGSCVPITNVARQAPGVSCILNPAICTGGSICTNGICTCPFGTTNINGICTPTTTVTSYSPPGGPCIPTQIDCTGNSICANGFCICPGGEQIRNGVCVSTDSQADPGQICQVGITTCTGNSLCQNGICTCPTGQTSLGGQCVRVVTQIPCNPPCGLNAQCINSGCQCNQGYAMLNGQCLPQCTGTTVCPQANSICQQGVCQCSPGYSYTNGACQPSCSASCSPNGACNNGVCQCNQGYVYSQGQCTPQCFTNSQCIPNSQCNTQQNVCQCNSGYTYSNGLCQPSCSASCSPNGVCNNGVCQCNSGYSYSNGQCYPQCFSIQQCTPNSSCQQGTCQCNTGYSYNNGLCQPSCSDSCSNGYCSNGVCNCNTGYVYSNGLCSPQCSSTQQCTPNSSCQQGTCQCNTGYIYSNGVCQPSFTPSCSPSCSNGYCSNGVCQCNTGYSYSNGACYPQCSATTQCSPNSFCSPQQICQCSTGYAYSNGLCQPNQTPTCTNGVYTNGVCQCNPGYVYAQNQCYPQCFATAQCVPNASCQQGACLCNAGYVYSQNQCTPQCFSNSQCSAYATCQQNACVCNAGYANSNGLCYAQCSTTQQCTPNASCQQGICSCNTGYSYYQGQCSPSCNSNAQCFPNSSCQQNVCTCNTGYIYSNGQCSPSCNSNLQCSPNSNCNQQGVCSCNTGFTYSQGQCYPSCSSNYQCTPNSSCQQGYCACNSGYSYSNGQCNPTIQCSPCQPNASCQQGSCQCNVGYFPGNTGSCLPSYTPALPINPFFGLPGQPCDQRVGAQLCRNRALCVNNLCVCPTNLILAGRECIDYAGDAYPGQSCNSANICRGGASCYQGTCMCNPGFYPNGPDCLPSYRFTFSFLTTPNPFELLPGSPCNPICQFQPCLQSCGGGSVCVSGTCICPFGSYLFNSQCIPQNIEPLLTTSSPTNPVTNLRTARPGDYCDVSYVCTGGSSCVLGSCTCDPGYSPSFDRTSCIRNGPPLSQRSYPGGTCVKDNDCQGNSYCNQLGVCSCLEDEEIKQNSCKKRPNIRAAYPGSPCSQDKVCSAGSVCQAGYCICPAGTATNSTGACVSILSTDTDAALPGSRCSIGSPCDGGSWCVDNYCLCQNGARNRGDGQCVRGRDSPSPSPPPLIDNRIDNNGVSGQLPTPQALQGKKRCSSFRQCDEPRICGTSGFCECPFTMTETSSGICVYRNNQVPPGSFCDGTSTRCQPPSTCVNRRCACPSGYSEQSGTCRLTGTNNRSPRRNSSPRSVAPGAACLPRDSCVSGAACILGVCQCQNGKPNSDNTACILINKRNLRLRPPEERLRPCPTDGSCKLPDCFCSQSGTAPPGGLDPKRVPQMVILTFDDPVTDRTINIYKSMFNGKFRNPNGCPIKGTFFVSHEFNNYDQTQWLHSQGNEIGLNSITHEKLNNATKERWRHEMVGLRESLKAFSYVEPSSVRGVRAPHLLIGGDNQFDMMIENSLLYDNSLTAHEGPVWPQTLDYQLAWDCGEQNCPLRAHKGLWSIPMQLISSNDGIWHSLARTAVKPYDTRETTHRLLQRNFYRNYNGNRAPFVLNADSEFLTYLPDNGVVHAVEDWLKEILNNTDVYVVTASQAIEWMKRPISSEGVSKFKPWQCKFRQNDQILPCENPSICSYDSRGPTGMPHSFRICGSCPPSYPWVSDPTGRKLLRV